MEAAEQLQLFLIPTQQKQEGMDDGDGGPHFLAHCLKSYQGSGKAKAFSKYMRQKDRRSRKICQRHYHSYPQVPVEIFASENMTQYGPEARKGKGDSSIGCSMKRLLG